MKFPPIKLIALIYYVDILIVFGTTQQRSYYRIIIVQHNPGNIVNTLHELQ